MSSRRLDDVTMIQPSPRPGPTRLEHFKGGQSIGLGITLIILGCLSIAFMAAASAVASNMVSEVLSTNYHHTYGGYGYWCGAMYVLTGALGIPAGKTKTRGLIIANRVCAIIGSVLAALQFLFATLGASLMGGVPDECRVGEQDSNSLWSSVPKHLCSELETIFAMIVLLVIVSAIAFGASLWASVICCSAIGCCCSQPVYVPSGPSVIITTQQQQWTTYPGAYGQRQGGYPSQGVVNPPPYDQKVTVTGYDQPTAGTVY